MQHRKLIIDTDCGLDDALAILLALNDPSVKILAITAVCGNTCLQNVVTNVLRVLRAAGRQLPIYKGASCSLLNTATRDAKHYHGEDGLGDFADHEPVTFECVQSEHAVNAISRILREEDDVELICLGPLTNLALALRLDPGIGSRIKHLAIMGGNYQGKGNITDASEFNFYRDPEAAHIVLQDLTGTQITLLPWETCAKHCVPFENIDSMLTSKSRKTQFVRNILTNVITQKAFDGFVSCDEMLVACHLNPQLVQQKFQTKLRVQLACSWARGMCVVIHGQGIDADLANLPTVTVMTEIDHQAYWKLFTDCMNQ